MAREPIPLRPEPTAEELCEDGAMTIKAFVEFTGVGRTKVYQLMRAHRLHAIHVGGRTFRNPQAQSIHNIHR